MADTPDFAKMMQDAAAAFRFDGGKMQDAFRTSAGYGEKLSQVALGAAQQSAELSAKMARDTLGRLGDLSKAKDSPTDYGQAMADFVRSQADLMSGQMQAFAEIARKVQAETVEVLTQAAQSVSSEAGDAVRKAASGMERARPKK